MIILACQSQSLDLVATSLIANSFLGKPDPFLAVLLAAMLAVIRARDVPRCKEIIRLATAIIRKRLQWRRGRKRRPGATPSTDKDAWTSKTMEEATNEWREAQRRNHTQLHLLLPTQQNHQKLGKVQVEGEVGAVSR